MCRETRMAVAAAQLAIADAGFAEKPMDPEMSGVVLGSDYMLTMPEDYELGHEDVRPAASSSSRSGAKKASATWPRCGCSSICPTCRPAISRSTTTSAARTTRSPCAKRPATWPSAKRFARFNAAMPT